MIERREAIEELVQRVTDHLRDWNQIEKMYAGRLFGVLIEQADDMLLDDGGLCPKQKAAVEHRGTARAKVKI